MASTNYVPGPVQPFDTQLGLLIVDAGYIAGSNLNQEQRSWQVPNAYLGWDFNIFNLAGPTSITAAFDRATVGPGGASINERYVTALRNGAKVDDNESGKVGETRNAKYQNDELACMERAYRTRVASPIRCAMHAASRRTGHNSTVGVIGKKIALCTQIAQSIQVDNLPDQNTPTSSSDIQVADNATESPYAII